MAPRLTGVLVLTTCIAHVYVHVQCKAVKSKRELDSRNESLECSLRAGKGTGAVLEHAVPAVVVD